MSKSASKITLIGFDADDTLWNHEHYFRHAEEQFVTLLSDHAEPEHITARLLAAEQRNLSFYGFGAKGFTLSMMETALEITNGKAPGDIFESILSAGRDVMAHPIETLPGVVQTLESLSDSYRLLLITKGDLFDQERKLAQSGLRELFHAVEIVSDKTEATYEHAFNQYGDGPANAVMVGNSIKSDILPAIAAGAWGIHIPHEHNWVLDHARPPVNSDKFYQVSQFDEIEERVKTISD